MQVRFNKTERIAGDLSKLGEETKGTIQLIHEHTHEKLLICTNKYYLNGNYNFLSYSPYGESFFRNEGCIYIVDEVYASMAIQDRFDF